MPFEVMFKCLVYEYLEPEWRSVPVNTEAQAWQQVFPCPIHEEQEMIPVKVKQVGNKRKPNHR